MEGIREEDARAKLRRDAEGFLAVVREAQLHVADRAAVVRTLIARGVGGRDYISALREAGGVPLLMVPATPAE